MFTCINAHNGVSSGQEVEVRMFKGSSGLSNGGNRMLAIVATPVL